MGVHRTCGEPAEIKKIPTRKTPPIFSTSRQWGKLVLNIGNFKLPKVEAEDDDIYGIPLPPLTRAQELWGKLRTELHAVYMKMLLDTENKGQHKKKKHKVRGCFPGGVFP